MQKATESLKAADNGAPNTPQVSQANGTDLEQNVKDLRIENVRIQNQLEYIKLQNQEILKRLSVQR